MVHCKLLLESISSRPWSKHAMRTEMDTKNLLLGAVVGALVAGVIIVTAGAAGALIMFKARPATVSASLRAEAWEYQVIRARPPNDMQQAINAAAAEGWDFAAALPYTDSAYAVM